MKFLIVGTGALENELKQKVESLGMTDKIIFTGRVNIIEYFEKLDFTLLTSISEGQPLSVLESFAARRPCVTTDVGCCNELLDGGPNDTLGKAGYFVPPMQREKLADAMEMSSRHANRSWRSIISTTFFR